MGNEDKVKDLVQTKYYFLKDGENIGTGQVEVYSLEQELFRNKKNKSYGLVLIIILFIALLGGGAFIISEIIQRRGEDIDVNIAEFEDLRLREILSEAQNAESRLRMARADLDDLKRDRNNEINRVKADSEKELEIIINRSLSPEDRGNLVADLRARERERIAKIEESYEQKIADKEQQILELEVEVAEIDSETMARVARSDKIVNNYEYLANLKLKQQEERYEQRIREINSRHRRDIANLQSQHRRLTAALIERFNPTFKNEQNILEIIERPVDDISFATPSLKDFSQAVKGYRVPDKVDYGALRQKIFENTVLLRRMNRISYTNAVPQALVMINELSRDIVAGYEDIWVSLVGVIKKQDSLLEHYYYAFNSYARLNRANGYILDARDTDNIVAFVEGIYTPKEGDLALIYRDELYIGKVSLIPKDDRVIVRIEELEEDRKIQPLDKILLLLK